MAAVRGLGLSVVGESYQGPAWQEAFVLPNADHGTLVQLASSDRSYPSPTVLLGNPERVPEQYPSVAGATDPGWWTPVWGSPRGEPARLAATRMASTDLVASRGLFEGVLGTRTRNADDGLRFSWASGGALDVAYRDHPGVLGMVLHGGPVGGLRIGSALLGSPTTSCRAEHAVPVAERHTP